MADDLTIAILREIRDAIQANGAAIRANGERIDQTNRRLDLTNERLDLTNERLDLTNERISGLEFAMNELSQQHAFLVRMTRAGNARDRRIEGELITLRERVGKLERRMDEG